VDGVEGYGGVSALLTALHRGGGGDGGGSL